MCEGRRKWAVLVHVHEGRALGKTKINSVSACRAVVTRRAGPYPFPTCRSRFPQPPAASQPSWSWGSSLIADILNGLPKKDICWCSAPSIVSSCAWPCRSVAESRKPWPSKDQCASPPSGPPKTRGPLPEGSLGCRESIYNLAAPKRPSYPSGLYYHDDKLPAISRCGHAVSGHFRSK